jgi:hypothetical protein
MTGNEYHGTPRVDIIDRLARNADVLEAHGYTTAAHTMPEAAAIIATLRRDITADELNRLADAEPIELPPPASRGIDPAERRAIEREVMSHVIERMALGGMASPVIGYLRGIEEQDYPPLP